MKKSLIASLSAVALLLTGCSSSSDSADSGGEHRYGPLGPGGTLKPQNRPYVPVN